jgi:hypothetical protein
MMKTGSHIGEKDGKLMDKFESSYGKFMGYTKSMLNVLCFDCGGMYQVPYGVSNPTKQCAKCQGTKTPLLPY